MNYQRRYNNIRSWYDGVRNEIEDQFQNNDMSLHRMGEIGYECEELRKKFYLELMENDQHPANNSRAKEIINLLDMIQFDMFKISGLLR